MFFEFDSYVYILQRSWVKTNGESWLISIRVGWREEKLLLANIWCQSWTWNIGSFKTILKFISSSQTIFNCLRPDLFHLLKRTMKWCFNSSHSHCFWAKEISLWEHFNHIFLFVIVSRFLLLMFKSWSFRLDMMWAKSLRPPVIFFFSFVCFHINLFFSLQMSQIGLTDLNQSFWWTSTES